MGSAFVIGQMSLKSTPSVDFITKLTQHPRRCVCGSSTFRAFMYFYTLLSFFYPPLSPLPPPQLKATFPWLLPNKNGLKVQRNLCIAEMVSFLLLFVFIIITISSSNPLFYPQQSSRGRPVTSSTDADRSGSNCKTPQPCFDPPTRVWPLNWLGTSAATPPGQVMHKQA